MPGVSPPVEVFYSYAHEDEALRTELEKHLSLLHRQGFISGWHDRHIAPGTDWAQAIDEHLESASVILLLVSADFLASDYCYGIELQRALQRHQAHEAIVIPILLRAVDWHGAPFAHLQALPTDGKAIITWSNQDEAFVDVATGIRRAVEDLSSLQASAPRAGLPPVWNVPYPRNAFFIGREALLARLRRQLQASQATAISQPQAISGLGGIGKTQLAVEYAYRYHQDYQVVLWARAETTEALTSSYVTIASLLSLPEREAQEQAITIQAVKTWLQTHRGWLLILDNADDLALVPAFLPPALGGHLLLTTRAAALGRLAGRLEVEALFLLRRAGVLAPDAGLAQAYSSDQGLAVQISEALGGLPLALDQAEAYLEEVGCSLSDYQQLYQRHHVALFKERRGLVADHPEPVATTWSLSFARVEAASPAAADLLRLCAYLAPDAIAEEIITAGAEQQGPNLGPVAFDALLFGQAMEALRAYSLIGRDPATQTVSVHRLVQAVVRDGMDTAGRQCWAERAIRAVHAALPKVEYASWPQWERLLAHAQACTEWVEPEGLHLQVAAAVLQQAGWYLTERARYSEAEPLLVRAYQMSEREQGAEHLDTARNAVTLAELYRLQGKYEQAERLYVRALAIYEQKLGPLHPNTALSLNGLAALYHERGREEEAEPLLRRALTIREQTLGSDHPDTATSYYWLAVISHQHQHYEAAEPLYQRALSIWERLLGPHHPQTSALRRHYVSLLRAMGRDDEARALEMKHLHLPPS